MSKDILMIIHTMGTLLPSDNDRFTYLAKCIQESCDATVEIVTSDFEHHKKKYRNQEIANMHPYMITFLHEKAYKKNVSLSRISGHKSFAKNLRKYLANRNKPDVIYCAVPPLSSAKVVADYANRNNIRFVVDIQDLWPESFEMVLGKGLISRIVLKPMLGKADAIYSKADAIFAVSETFARRASKVNNKVVQARSIYLGTDSSVVESALMGIKTEKNTGEFWIGYVGNIGVSYEH